MRCVAGRSRVRHTGEFSARAAAFQAVGDLGRWASAVGVDQQSLQEALPEGNEMWELNDQFCCVWWITWRHASQLGGVVPENSCCCVLACFRCLVECVVGAW